MKKLYYLIVLTLILGLVLTGCLLSNVGQVPINEQSGISYLTKATEKTPNLYPLYAVAVQYSTVGTVEVWNDIDNLYVKYVVNGPWRLTETHLAVVTNPALFPMNKIGNPKVGKFAYGEKNIFTETWGETIKLEDLEVEAGDTLYIAAHAVVVDTSSIITETFYPKESAWAGGTRFTEQGNWATYFGYIMGPVQVNSVTGEIRIEFGEESWPLVFDVHDRVGEDKGYVYWWTEGQLGGDWIY